MLSQPRVVVQGGAHRVQRAAQTRGLPAPPQCGERFTVRSMASASILQSPLDAFLSRSKLRQPPDLAAAASGKRRSVQIIPQDECLRSKLTHL